VVIVLYSRFLIYRGKDRGARTGCSNWTTWRQSAVKKVRHAAENVAVVIFSLLLTRLPAAAGAARYSRGERILCAGGLFANIVAIGAIIGG